MWQFEKFSVIQILREINFDLFLDPTKIIMSQCGNFRIFTHIWCEGLKLSFLQFWVLNLVNLVNFSFQKVQKFIYSKFRVSDCVIMANLALLQLPKLISRKILVIEKSWHFHTVNVQLFGIYFHHNWFHIKSEWQKNSKISSLCGVPKCCMKNVNTVHC